MKNLLRSLVVSGVGAFGRGLTNGPGPLRRLVALARSARDERRQVTTPHGTLIIGVSNPLERWRADTLLSKEPETIAWLERTFDAQCVLYDAGANIGLYSLYAAHMFPGQARVVCFEPEPLNYARLNLNIAHNGFSNRVTAFALGLGARDGIGTFPLSAMQAGGALHGERMVAPGAQAHTAGIVCRTLDSLLAEGDALAAPTHLKIDVDGPELDILRGAAATLRRPSLRHLLVELLESEIPLAEDLLTPAGFAPVERGAAVDGMVNVIYAKSQP